MRLARIVPLVLALASTGCGGCVGDSDGQEQPAAEGSSAQNGTQPRIRRPMRIARPPMSVLHGAQPDGG